MKKIKKIFVLLIIFIWGSLNYIKSDFWLAKGNNFQCSSDYHLKLTPLEKKIKYFFSLDNKTAILSEKDTDQAYFFNSEKVNASNTGLTNLEKKIDSTLGFIRLSNLSGIFNEKDGLKTYFFDSKKINNSNKGFVDLKIRIFNFYWISNTVMIFEDINHTVYIFDSTKVHDSSKGLINLTIKTKKCYPLSNTIILLSEFNTNDAYLLDLTKINEPNKRLIKLDKKILNFFKLSNNTGIFHEKNSEFTYFFDSKKINEANKGLTNLEKKMDVYLDFITLSETTGIFHEEISKHIYLLDITKINQPEKAFINLELENVINDSSLSYVEFITLSNTTGIFKYKKPYFNFKQWFEGLVSYFYYFLDFTKINHQKEILIKIKIKIKILNYITLSENRGILSESQDHKTYYFEYH